MLELNIANHARGVVSMDRNGRRGLGKDYESSIQHFELALDRQPTNEHTIDRYCRACKGRAQELEKKAEELMKSGRIMEHDEAKKEAKKLRKKGEHWLTKAGTLPDPHEDTWLSLGLMMIEKANKEREKLEREKAEDTLDDVRMKSYKETERSYLERASGYLNNALKKNPAHRHAGFMYVDVMRWLHGDDIIQKLDYDKLICRDGANALFHLFCFHCMSKRWGDAVRDACELKEKLEVDERKGTLLPNDEEALRTVREFLGERHPSER